MNSTEQRRNQRKSPLTPKKNRDKEIDAVVTNARIGGGRIKKVKVPFDPSEDNFPRRRFTIFMDRKLSEVSLNSEPPNKKQKTAKRSSKSMDSSDGDCIYCGKIKRDDKTVNCKECSTTVHLSCIKSKNDYIESNNTLLWLCPDCVTCHLCYETAMFNPLYKCNRCFINYHLECNDPLDKDKTVEKDKFCCRNCVQYTESLTKDEKIFVLKKKNKSEQPIYIKRKTRSNSRLKGFAGFDSEEIHSTTLGTEKTNSTLEMTDLVEDEVRLLSNESNKPQSPNEIIDLSESETVEFCQENIVLTIPDATNWDSDDVYKYFVKYFPKEAHVFKDQEIDGPSLLLMKRNDVVRGLCLKLGPAIKIYDHVLRLQTKNSDFTAGWM